MQYLFASRGQQIPNLADGQAKGSERWSFNRLSRIDGPC